MLTCIEYFFNSIFFVDKNGHSSNKNELDFCLLVESVENLTLNNRSENETTDMCVISMLVCCCVFLCCVC